MRNNFGDDQSDSIETSGFSDDDENEDQDVDDEEQPHKRKTGRLVVCGGKVSSPSCTNLFSVQQ